MDKIQKRLLLISLGISFTVLFLFLLFTIDVGTLEALKAAHNDIIREAELYKLA